MLKIRLIENHDTDKVFRYRTLSRLFPRQWHDRTAPYRNCADKTFFVVREKVFPKTETLFIKKKERF